MTRLKPIDTDKLNMKEAAVYASIAGVRGAVRGPFLALLHSPELASRVEQLGAYVRYQCTVPERWRELAILVVARHWRADFEWFAHHDLAVKQGLSVTLLLQLGKGDIPEWDQAGDAIVHSFCASLLRDGGLDDALYARATELLSPQGVVDLVGLVGYYTLLALTLNAHVVTAPANADIPWHSQK
jgi:4-carboxymuconolactone decarboxylase